ncbi:MAG: acyltransferase [Hyphomicrobiaceae bacterium]
MMSLGPGQFRVLLALAVVLSHLSNYEVGRPAVFAFFTLSGFWVMRMYDEKYRGAGGAPIFYISRLLRIWLPFAVAYLGFLTIKSAGFGEGGAGALVSLPILGIATSHVDVLGVSWSLDIELQFYLLVPAIWLLLERHGGDVARGAGGRRAVPVLWPMLAAIALAVPGWWLILRHDVTTVLAFLPSFAAGILLWRSDWRPGWRTAMLSVAVFLGIGGLVWLQPDWRGLMLKDVETTLHEDLFGIAWMLALVPFIAYNVHRPSSRLDQHLGNYSYALYITHWPVIWLSRRLIAGDGAGLDRRVLTVAAILAVSVAFYVIVDRNCERLRQWLIRSRRPLRQAA